MICSFVGMGSRRAKQEIIQHEGETSLNIKYKNPDQILPLMKVYKYLGTLTDATRSFSHEVRARGGQGFTAARKIKRYLLSKALKLTTRAAMINTYNSL